MDCILIELQLTCDMMNQNSQDYFVNRRKVLAMLRLMVRHKRSGCMLTVEAPKNMGKSLLLREMQSLCDRWNVPCALINLANGQDEGLNYQTIIEKIQRETDYEAFLDVVDEFNWLPLPPRTESYSPIPVTGTPDVLAGGGLRPGTISGDIHTGNISGEVVTVGSGAIVNVHKTFMTQDNEKTQTQRMLRVNKRLIETLKKLTQEDVWVLLFDSYERCLPGVEKWFNNHFIPPIIQGRLPNLFVVIAGRDNIATLQTRRSPVATHYQLDKFDISIIEQYLKKRDVTLSKAKEVFNMSLQGIPGRLSIIVDGYCAIA